MDATMDSSFFLMKTAREYSKREDVQKVMRFPQFLFNKLAEEKPEIANEILGTTDDFFYDEILTKDKWDKVCEYWTKENV